MLFVGVTEGVEVGSRVAVNVNIGVNVRVNVCEGIRVNVAVTVTLGIVDSDGTAEGVKTTGVATADPGAIAMETWQPMMPSPSPISKKKNPMR